MNYITVKEYAKMRNCAERTILKQIASGRLVAKRDGRRWLVQVEDTVSAPSAEPVPNNTELIKQLQSENEYLRQELSEARQRTDTIILSLTRQMEALQAPPRRSFWDRFKRK